EPDARRRRRRRRLGHDLALEDSPRRARPARAGHARSRGRGAAPRLRNPGDRSRSSLGVLDPSRVDSRAAVVSREPASATSRRVPVVSLSAVRVTYGDRDVLAVDSFDVLDHEVLAVIGPNGSGKSTLLRVIGLLEEPNAGEVRFHGEPIDRARALA